MARLDSEFTERRRGRNVKKNLYIYIIIYILCISTYKLYRLCKYKFIYIYKTYMHMFSNRNIYKVMNG